MAAPVVSPEVLGQTIVNFAKDGQFPEDDEISKSYVEETALASALQAVQNARTELEDEIKAISRESAADVDDWVKNARALKDDIETTKSLSAQIARDAEAGDALYKTVKEDGEHVEFLRNEIVYSSQLLDALQGIKVVKEMLDEAEVAGEQHRILEALNILAGAWDFIGNVPAHQMTQPMSLLNKRSYELKASIHDSFDNTWNELVHFDALKGSLTVNSTTQGGTDMERARTVIKAYKEDQKRLQKLFEDLDEIIIRPRVVLANGVLKSITIEGNTISANVDPPASLFIKDLFIDLDKIVNFIANNFDPEWAHQLSSILMPRLTKLIKETWLDSAVPTSLDEMTEYRKTIALVQVFAETISNLGWEGAEELHDWVADAPRLWVTKRREASLDYTRRQLAKGIRSRREVEKTETQIITESEQEQIGANVDGAADDLDDHGWDNWSDGGKDEGKEPKSSTEPSRTVSTVSISDQGPTWTSEVLKKDEEANKANDDEDDGADAWGWGDEDDDNEKDEKKEPEPMSETPSPKATRVESQPQQRATSREVTLTEKYTISSMPDPVFKTIVDILEDGVSLTKEEHSDNPVTAAAVGLFGLPTLVLAMYRAVSPWYYALASGGNMHCYNDSMYLADKLRTLAVQWSQRDDLGPRAQGKVRLDGEIAALEKFSRKAYGNEMSTQRTIITDLLAGSQNFIQEGDANDNQLAIDSVVAHIRALSTEWKGILSKSAWAQAVGSLLSTVAKKIILDVEDLTSLGADEAYRVANLISSITKLDDLFMPEDKSAPQIPLTSQYAHNWLKLSFLSEVLQSDLKDLQYLWFESDLSVHFLAEEVVDLIELSFESNYRTKELIRKIREDPFPRGVRAEKMV